MIHCIAIDDEPLALEVIKKYVSETPLLGLTNVFTDAIQALAFLKVHKTDLIFLDIHMPDISGIQFINALKERPRIIFTTAFSQYAAKGFELEAIDYLVKPFTFDRFMKAVMRVKKAMETDTVPAETGNDFFFVKSEYHSVKICIQDILYIEGLDDYIKIYLQGSKPVLSLMSMKAILEKLPKDRFMRVHRSFIVPLNNILSIRNRKIFLDQREIPIGDTYGEAVKEWLAKR
ncbi:MAG: DNA-binding response regulator [Bacteroidota bacterium]|nr:DNA-binding response regulator [Bacteroidota bacterium]